MKSIVYLAIATAIVCTGCSKDKDNPAPSACFMVDQTGSTDPTHTFIFTNCSDYYNRASWDFGDGHSSSEFNPSHRFDNIGEYTVRLTVSNSDGATDVNTRIITVGHYTLTKIIYNKLNGTINFPKRVYWSYFNSMGLLYTNETDINTASQVPYTVTLPEDPIYDNYSSNHYRFSEYDNSGNNYILPDFNISDLEITNGQLDKTFYHSGDSAKVSLYFKIVPR